MVSDNSDARSCRRDRTCCCFLLVANRRSTRCSYRVGGILSLSEHVVEARFHASDGLLEKRAPF